MTPTQQEVADTLSRLSERIYNQERFSDTDISRILSEIKSVHALYKKAFNESALVWQVDYYSMQMALENEYKFIFVHEQRMTWTPGRWRFAILTELAILHYRDKEGEEMVMEGYGFQIMCMWLFFQFFNACVFTGAQCKEVFDATFPIVKDADNAISESIQGIKQWRKDNDNMIAYINYQKSRWRQEKARIDRLLDGRMKQKEVELYHILYWADPRLPFDANIRIASRGLGVSVQGLRKTTRDHGIDEANFSAYLSVYKEEADARYEKEHKWAEKVRSNTLTKKERKAFWQKFSIPNPHILFRTFTSAEADLIPAANPLLTTEDCVAPTQEQTLPLPSKMDMISKDGAMQMPSMTLASIEGWFC